MSGRSITNQEALAALMLHCVEIGRRASKIIGENGQPAREVLVPDEREIADMIKSPPPRWGEAMKEAGRLVGMIASSEPRPARGLQALFQEGAQHFQDIHEQVTSVVRGEALSGPAKGRRR